MDNPRSGTDGTASLGAIARLPTMRGGLDAQRRARWSRRVRGTLRSGDVHVRTTSPASGACWRKRRRRTSELAPPQLAEVERGDPRSRDVAPRAHRRDPQRAGDEFDSATGGRLEGRLMHVQTEVAERAKRRRYVILDGFSRRSAMAVSPRVAPRVAQPSSRARSAQSSTFMPNPSAPPSWRRCWSAPALTPPVEVSSRPPRVRPIAGPPFMKKVSLRR